MATKKDPAVELWLTGRLSYPYIFEPQPPHPQAPPGAKLAYTCDLILEDPAELAKAKAAFEQVAKATWGDNWMNIMKALGPEKRMALRDSAVAKLDDTGNVKDGYQGHWFLAMRSYIRVPIMDRDGKTPLVASDGKPYGGCYVRNKARVWSQTGGKYGRRLNCQLMGVQFVKDGEAFGGGKVASPDEFSNLDEFANEGEAAGSDDAGGLW